jgi:hypothetical protein
MRASSSARMCARRLPGRRNAVGEGARPRHAKIVGTLSVHRAGSNRVEHVGGQQPALGDDGFHRALAFADTNVALRRARRRTCAPGLRRCILRQMQMPSVGMALRRLAATDGVRRARAADVWHAAQIKTTYHTHSARKSCRRARLRQSLDKFARSSEY